MSCHFVAAPRVAAATGRGRPRPVARPERGVQATVSSATRTLPLVSGLNRTATRKMRQAHHRGDEDRTRKGDLVGGCVPDEQRRDQPAPDRPLVEAEGDRRRPHLGREALGEIGRVLNVHAAAGKHSLQGKSDDDQGVVVGQQVKERGRNPERRRDDDRPAPPDAFRHPAPEQRGEERKPCWPARSAARPAPG